MQTNNLLLKAYYQSPNLVLMIVEEEYIHEGWFLNSKRIRDVYIVCQISRNGENLPLLKKYGLYTQGEKLNKSENWWEGKSTHYLLTHYLNSFGTSDNHSILNHENFLTSEVEGFRNYSVSGITDDDCKRKFIWYHLLSGIPNELSEEKFEAVKNILGSY